MRFGLWGTFPHAIEVQIFHLYRKKKHLRGENGGRIQTGKNASIIYIYSNVELMFIGGWE